MYVTLVHVKVKPECIDEFVAASRSNHVGSIEEIGNRRFDILQDAEEPTKFVLYEAYVSAAAATGHKASAHYLKWRDEVADMMAESRQGVRYDGLFPAD